MYDIEEIPLSQQIYIDVENNYEIFSYMQNLEKPQTIYTISDFGDFLPENVRTAVRCFKDKNMLSIYKIKSEIDSEIVVESYLLRKPYENIFSQLNYDEIFVLADTDSRNVLWHLNTVDNQIGDFHSTDYVIADNLNLKTSHVYSILDNFIDLNFVIKEDKVYRNKDFAVPYTTYSLDDRAFEIFKIDCELKTQILVDIEEEKLKNSDTYFEKKAKQNNV